MLLRLCAMFFLFCFAGTAQAASPLLPGKASAQDKSGLSVTGTASEVAVSPGTDTTLHILIRIIAPTLPDAEKRPPLNVALVIDRSGSMGDAKKLDYAIRAGKEVVRILGPEDKLALVTYDDTVIVNSPLAHLKNKDALNKMIDALQPGGYTFLSGGLEAGLKQLADKNLTGVRRVILLSDGLANKGVTDVAGIGKIGGSARDKGTTISTMGLGRDYDENLMQQLAQRGGGQYSYVRDSEDLPGFFRQELALAAQTAVRGLTLRITPVPGVKNISVYGYTTKTEGKDTLVEMSDLASGEERQIMLRMTMAPEASAVAANLADLALVFTPASEKEGAPAQRLAVPAMSVAVKADAAERDRLNTESKDVTKPVQDEALLMQAEEAHVAALAELEKGRVQEAKAIMQTASGSLAAAAPSNKMLANKMAALQKDAAVADQAAGNMDMQKEMVKKGKSSYYMSSQGKGQALMLQKGDNGALVEKLQRALADKTLYSGEVNGQYTEEVENAVRAFQKAQNLDVDGIAGQATMNALGM